MTRPLPVKMATAPCVIFQSSYVNRSGRFGYVAELMKHIGVHSYGKIFNNRAIPDHDRGAATKLEIVSRYKFCLAMENSICEDYVTEKLFEPFLCGSVPVYLGAPNVDRYTPDDHALINVRDFAGPKALAEFLHQLDQDDVAYRRYFDWHRQPLRSSLEQDIDRKGIPLVRLWEAVRARLPVTRDANACPVGLSFDPRTQGFAGPGMSVSEKIYAPGKAKLRPSLYRIRRKARSWFRAGGSASTPSGG